VVKILNCISDKVHVTSGVPQGSVLGPTLFLIFINDICDVVADLNVTMKLFADDAKIYSELDLGLSNDLCTACDRIMSWAENWQMRLATNKCTALRITNKTSHDATSADHYMLGKEHLNWCTEARDLGVLIDNKLQFNQHIASVVHKARARARLIVRSFCSRDSSVLMKAFITYVRPMLEYCSSVWSPSTVANITN
jgi:ribonuclease P/MRP protein subunit RPP40